MIRILQLPGTISLSNGRMTVIMNAYRQLVKHNVQFDFLVTATNQKSYAEEIRKMGGNIFEIPQQKETIANVRNKMKNVLKENNSYVAVHYHAISIWGMTIDIPFQKKIKVITHSHSSQFSDSMLKSIRNRIFSMNIFLFSHMFIACSNEAGKKFFHGKDFVYLPNAIDPSPYYFDMQKRLEYRKNFGISKDELVIGNVGRIVKQKNQQYLLDILKDILKLGVDAKLVIVGDGPDRSKLTDKIKNNGLTEYVVLTGSTGNTNEYYSAFDVFVLPSLFEGLPMVSIEAQANGLPIILSDRITRQSDMGSACFLDIKNNNVSQWVGKILEAAKKGRETKAPDYIKKYGFDVTKTYQQWEIIYDS